MARGWLQVDEIEEVTEVRRIRKIRANLGDDRERLQGHILRYSLTRLEIILLNIIGGLLAYLVITTFL